MDKEKYILPEDITQNMGGEGDQLDTRMTNIIEILEEIPMDSLSTFLDIGMGKGQISKWLSKKGKKCTGTGIEMASYGVEIKDLKKNYNIESVECSIETMPFPDKSFDVVIMSHILEHCQNVGNALSEVRRVLKDNGWLFVFVPPDEDRVLAGHLSVGWNIGQLMYVLLINKFDIKSGKFIKYNYNVCGLVQKNIIPLPQIRGDRGDIHILQKQGLFPLPIKTKDGLNDGFYGNIKSINWYADSKILKKISRLPTNDNKILNIIKVFLFKLSKYIPERVKDMLKLLISHRKSDSNDIVNPTVLKG